MDNITISKLLRKNGDISQIFSQQYHMTSSVFHLLVQCRFSVAFSRSALAPKSELQLAPKNAHSRTCPEYSFSRVHYYMGEFLWDRPMRNPRTVKYFLKKYYYQFQFRSLARHVAHITLHKQV